MWTNALLKVTTGSGPVAPARLQHYRVNKQVSNPVSTVRGQARTADYWTQTHSPKGELVSSRVAGSRRGSNLLVSALKAQAGRYAHP